jgi:hypothetical protein
MQLSSDRNFERMETSTEEYVTTERHEFTQMKGNKVFRSDLLKQRNYDMITLF